MEKEINKKREVLRIAVPLGAALIVTHAVAVINDLYRSVPWIDILIHYGWAVALGFFVYLVIEHFPGHIDLSKNLFVTILVGLSLSGFGGILWEFGEFMYDVTGGSFGLDLQDVQLGIGDTLKDLLVNMLGGMSVAIFVWLRYHKKRESL